MTDYIDQVFGPGGILATEFPNYEARQGQIDLARAVDQALRDGRHLIGEGPCGTGKSLAYGVPAVWHSVENRKRMSAYEAQLEAYEAKWGKIDPFAEEDPPDDGRPPPPEEPPPHRIVIATANINLQEQLTKKDLPLLQRLLPWKFSFALYKGRSHYLCEDRYRENQAKGLLPGGGLGFSGQHHEELVQIARWHDTTSTGDESELSFVPDPKHWAMVAVGSDDCLGVDCEFAKRRFRKQGDGTYHETFDGPKCFANEAKARAQAADIIVTNFHMLFAHVGVSMATEGNAQLLPEFAYLIVDEAHELADVARHFFGFNRTANGIKRLAKRLKDWAGSSLDGATVLRGVDQAEDATDTFFQALTDFAHTASYDGRIRPGQLVEVADPAPILESLRWIAVEAENRMQIESLPKRERTKAERVYKQASKAHANIGEAFEASDPDRVYSIEEERHVTKLTARVVNVGPIIAAELFDKLKSACLVSATLTTNGTFSFAKKETGLEFFQPIEIVAESPFNFEQQALLILPSDMPDPKREEFVSAASDVFDRVIDHFKGRTLGLFTSYKTMKAVAERLRSKGVTVLLQGEKPRHELAKIFREDISSVLLGTSSFWTGIDVPGESLSAVIIDKLPFPQPGDPVVSAITEADPKAFFNYSIPRATIQLRQGVGRLIRSKTDTGIVVILDPRIADKSYGKHFRRSLPSMRMTRDLDNIPVFMAEANEWVLSRD